MFARGSTPVIGKKTKQMGWAEKERIHSDEKKKVRELLRGNENKTSIKKTKKKTKSFFVRNENQIFSNPHDDKKVDKA